MLLLTLVSASHVSSSQIYYSATGFQIKLCYVRLSAVTLNGAEAVRMYVSYQIITPRGKSSQQGIGKHDPGCSVRRKYKANVFGVIPLKIAN